MLFNTADIVNKNKMIDLDEMIETRPADFITKIKSESVKREDVKNNHDIIEENNVLQTSTTSDIKVVFSLEYMYKK